MKIDAILPGPALQILQQAAAPSLPTNDLASKFGALMHRASDVPTSLGAETSPVASMLVQQGDLMRKNAQDMRSLSAAVASGQLNDGEKTLRKIELMQQLSTTQFYFNTATTLAQSCKNGLQTLMKNQ